MVGQLDRDVLALRWQCAARFSAYLREQLPASLQYLRPDINRAEGVLRSDWSGSQPWLWDAVLVEMLAEAELRSGGIVARLGRHRLAAKVLGMVEALALGRKLIDEYKAKQINPVCDCHWDAPRSRRRRKYEAVGKTKAFQYETPPCHFGAIAIEATCTLANHNIQAQPKPYGRQAVGSVLQAGGRSKMAAEYSPEPTPANLDDFVWRWSSILSGLDVYVLAFAEFDSTGSRGVNPHIHPLMIGFPCRILRALDNWYRSYGFYNIATKRLASGYILDAVLIDSPLLLDGKVLSYMSKHIGKYAATDHSRLYIAGSQDYLSVSHPGRTPAPAIVSRLAT